MEALKRKRDLQSANITRVETYLDALQDDKFDRHELKARLDTLEKHWIHFEQIQNKIEEKCTKEEDITGEAETREEEEEKYIALKTRFLKLLDTVPTVPTTPPPEKRQAANVKLPKLELPNFQGDYTQWTSFRDLFTVLVADNENLKPVEKFQYLKSCLKGEPFRLIQALGITDVNYDKAWQIIEDRYENPRRIAVAHFKAIFNQPPLNGETAIKLRQLLDCFIENMEALEALKADTWDNIMVYLLTEKMDPDSRKLWEMTLKETTLPEFDTLKQFLQTRCQALEVTSKPSIPRKPEVSVNKKSSLTANAGTKSTPCQICNGTNHQQVYKCDKFHQMSVAERHEAVRHYQLCYNCLSDKHGSRTCPSTSTCKKCNQRHHTLLHKERVDNFVRASPTASPGAGIQSGGQSVTSAASHHVTTALSILPTIQLHISNGEGQHFTCRALLDSGSQVNFVTERIVQSLGLRRKKNSVAINGIGNRTTPSNGTSRITLHSIHSSFTTEVDALILNKITGNLPAAKVDSSKWSIPPQFPLADPDFTTPKPIDILLGIEAFMSLLVPSECLQLGTLSLFNTKFGWVAGGGTQTLNISPTSAFSCLEETSLDTQLRKFWQVEEVSEKSLLTEEEKLCESHFQETHTRDDNGRYVVRLPFKSTPNLGNSRQHAMSRILNQEKRLAQHPEAQREYAAFMTEYQDLGHMQPSMPAAVRSTAYYIPHHAVYKEASVTTKLRVVFDASAKTSSGKSLNDELMVGPIVQDDLCSLLMRFRTHPIALVADITKMFRQVKVHEEDWKYQNIFWREKPTAPLQEFQLTTVTYGTASGPFLATRVLQQLAKDEAQRFPEAAEILARDFYVDDCITGCDSPHQAKNLQEQLQQLLHRGGFELRKWASNHPSVITETDEIMHYNFPDAQVPALGLTWSPKEDVFTITPRLKEVNQHTKRTVLGDISRLFDPIGLVAPVVISAKILMQQIWLAGIDWDTELTNELIATWITIRDELQVLPNVQIPRFLGTLPGATIELHGFCDASEKAYGAVVYTRSIANDGSINIGLLCSKSKVAPLKTVNLPRLELCAAVLLTRLLRQVRPALSIPINSVTGWTDSTITLAWIQGEPRRWKTFVANRVAEIQEALSPSNWRHVKGLENPADLVSRGMTATELQGCNLWWHGPEWLSESILPDIPLKIEPEATWIEARSFVSRLPTSAKPDITWIERFPNWTRLLTVTAWILRFRNNCNPRNEKRRGQITSREIDEARQRLCQLTQRQHFKEEIKNLESGKEIGSKSPIKSLNPWLQDGLLRVGGRISNANVAFDTKHPIILPAKSHVTDLLVRHEHLVQLHSQTTLLLTSLRQRYWIIHGRDVVRRIVHQCLPCFRMRATNREQLMGVLPAPRVQGSRVAFLHCGLDYAGPITIKARGGRGRPILSKAYIALFVCLATKAIHLELVSDLTAEACIAMIRRFIARRGCPTDMYSDQGTNFKRAAQIFATMADAGPTATRMQSITWHFNPPAAPHFGGLWEAGVKSVKGHLHRTIGNATLTFEELYTVLTQIEACLNSRPLCPISDDPETFDYLTPGHFLVGTALNAPVEHAPPSIITPRQRWFHLQTQVANFWKRWTQEYLPGLQQRSKWKSASRNLQVGDLVLLKDTTPPLQWPLGRIIDVHPGKDNLVRAATLRTAKGTYLRPITKICPLPFN